MCWRTICRRQNSKFMFQRGGGTAVPSIILRAATDRLNTSNPQGREDDRVLRTTDLSKKGFSCTIASFVHGVLFCPSWKLQPLDQCDRLRSPTSNRASRLCQGRQLKVCCVATALEVTQPITPRRLQMESAQDGATRRVGTCWHDDRENLRIQQVDVVRSPRRQRTGLAEGASRPDRTSRHSTQSIGQNFDRTDRSVTTSENTFFCGFFRWHLGSEECGEIRHLKTRLTSWRTGTKYRKLQEEPSRYSPHNGQPAEIRISWKYIHRNSVRSSFWVSSESGRHLQNSGVIRTPSEQQLSRIRCSQDALGIAA